MQGNIFPLGGNQVLICSVYCMLLLMHQFVLFFPQYIKGPIQSSSLLDVELEHRVLCYCFNELKEFPKRFVIYYGHIALAKILNVNT